MDFWALKKLWGDSPSSDPINIFVLSVLETGLLLGVKLRRNVVMMRAGVKICIKLMRDARKTIE